MCSDILHYGIMALIDTTALGGTGGGYDNNGLRTVCGVSSQRDTET